MDLRSVPIWVWILLAVAVIAVVAPLKLKVLKTLLTRAKEKREKAAMDDD